MRKLSATLALLLSLCLWLGARNSTLNPTVNVTNEYSSIPLSAHRAPMPIEVPDSLLHFDLDFDYGGFETFYRGNDEFNPYFTDLEFTTAVHSSRKFHLKAGAGYTIHPVFDLQWTFDPLSRVKIGMHASNKSYFGDYVNAVQSANPVFKGYDSDSKAGFDLRSDWDRSTLLLQLNYRGIHSSESLGNPNTRGFNSGDANLRFFSKPSPGATFRHDVAAFYSFGYDSGSYAGAAYTANSEHNLRFDGKLDFGGPGSSFGVDFDLNYNFGFNAGNPYNAFSILLTPVYRLRTDRIHLSAGLSFLFNGGQGISFAASPLLKTDAFAILPSLDFVWKAVPQGLDLYAMIDMTPGFAGLRENALEYHFNIPDAPYVTRRGAAEMGFRSRLGKKVHLSAGAGYEALMNMPQAVPVLYGGWKNVYCLGLYHDSCIDDFNFKLSIDALFASFSLKGNVRYAVYLHPENHPVLPSALTADLSARYDLRKRASFYAGAEYRSSHSVMDYDVPFLLNIFAGAEYRLKPTASLFLEGRNLLNRSCQYIPGISEKGIAITGGIILNF